jgi:S-DNA-T family DNA segregation ATPase FtsK/SpoIIIE
LNGLGRNKNEKENKSLVFTRETLGVVLILFSTLVLVCLITRDSIFSLVGLHVNSFFFGLFGFFSYGVTVFAIIMGVLLISGKKTGLSAKRKFFITLIFSLITLIAHIATISGENISYGAYIVQSYRMGAGGISTTSAGGFFTALVAYAFSALLTNIGSFVVLGIALALTVYFAIKDWINATPQQKESNKVKFRSSFVKEDEVNDLDVDIAGTKEYPIDGVDFSQSSGKQKLFVSNPNDFAVKTRRELNREENNPNGLKLGFADGGLSVGGMSSDKEVRAPEMSDDFKKKLDYIKTPVVIDMDQYNDKNYNQYRVPERNATTVSDYVIPRSEPVEPPKSENIPFIEHENVPPVSPMVSDIDSVQARAQAFGDMYVDAIDTETEENTFIPETNEDVFRPVVNTEIVPPVTSAPPEPIKSERSEIFNDIPFIDETEEDETPVIDTDIFTERSRGGFKPEPEPKVCEEQQPVAPPEVEEKPTESNITSSRRIREILGEEIVPEEKVSESSTEGLGYTSRVNADNNGSARRGFGFTPESEPEVKPAVEEKPAKPAPPINREYFRPPFDLLETYSQPINVDQDNHEERMEIIKRTLEDFHINAVPQSFVQGPSITRYEIMMPAGISVKKVLNYDDDLKMRLAAKDGVRIEAPIPGKNLVGIEVANSVKVMVGLKEVMEGLAGKKSKPGSLMFALGKDIVGNSISDDLTKGPHYLIAGATGSGKSVCLHVMIVSLLMRYSPEELKIVLVDPKSVEFRKYEHIPHLLVDEIITEPKRALTLLQWAYDETNRRNEMFTECGGMISNIDDYNSQIASDTVPKLPRIVFVIDELADLMEACKKDLEARIRMIAAKSRSAGIHLVLATQRPSVDVITGTIKANLPSRIALKVMNFADSQTILGEAGAEKLLGNGDMLYKNSSMGDYERYQGAYISGREITNVVNYIKEHNKAYFDDGVQEFLDKETRPQQEETMVSGDDGVRDPNEIDDFFLKALWLAVNSESVSISQLQRRFQIGYARAGGLVDKMERLGFITGNEGSRARKVLLSKEEFERRFGSAPDVF